MNARVLLAAALTLGPAAVLAAIPATGHDREPATDARPAAEAPPAPLLAELTRLNRDRGRCGQ